MKVLILSRSEISSDPRVLRQIEWLEYGSHEVSVLGMGKSLDEYKCAFYPLKLRPVHIRLASYLFRVGWSRFNHLIESQIPKELFLKIRDGHFDLILLNDLDFVPLINKYQNDVAANFSATSTHIDIHEYFFSIRNSRLWNRMFGRQIDWELDLLMQTNFDSYSTVSKDIANKYKSRLNISEMSVILNQPKYHEVQIQTPSNKIKMIYHGNYDESRGVDLLIESMVELKNQFELHLMLTTSNWNITKLKKRVLKLGIEKSVFFAPAVPVKRIVEEISQYDLGCALFDSNVSESLKYALPNKFFEYIQARLPVIIGDAPSMLDAGEKYGVCIVVNAFTKEAVVESLSKINLQEILKLKIRTASAAKEFNSDKSRLVFFENLKRLEQKRQKK